MKKLILLSFLVFGMFILSCSTDPTDFIGNSVFLAKDDSLSVSLKHQESFIINDELQVSFLGVAADSRCPLNAMCVWAGDAEIKLNLKFKETTKEVSIHTTLFPKSILFERYEIDLIEVEPYPVLSSKIEQKDYFIKLKVRYNTNPDLRTVYMITSDMDWLIKKSPLVVNSVNINNNILTLSVSYGGGCKDHYIELFAYNGISKSLPPQMTLQLSHETNNDMCEAYITREIKFNIESLKQVLVGYSVVNLNILTPDGKIILQSPVSYKL